MIYDYAYLGTQFRVKKKRTDISLNVLVNLSITQNILKMVLNCPNELGAEIIKYRELYDEYEKEISKMKQQSTEDLDQKDIFDKLSMDE